MNGTNELEIGAARVRRSTPEDAGEPAPPDLEGIFARRSPTSRRLDSLFSSAVTLWVYHRERLLAMPPNILDALHHQILKRDEVGKSPSWFHRRVCACHLYTVLSWPTSLLWAGDTIFSL